MHITFTNYEIKYFDFAHFLYKQPSLVLKKKKLECILLDDVYKVRAAREAATKAQQLLENVANRKRNKQQELGGLVITKAIYGNPKALKKGNELRERDDESASQALDVTLPLNFLVNDSGKLKVCFFT